LKVDIKLKITVTFAYSPFSNCCLSFEQSVIQSIKQASKQSLFTQHTNNVHVSKKQTVCRPPEGY